MSTSAESVVASGDASWDSGLDPAQAIAVRHDEGPLVVLAGPGAGKTRVIVHRIARLVAPREAGGAAAKPESVLALAFTNKSADEMRARLGAMVGASIAERVRLSTCHAFGRGLVRRFGDRLGLPPEPDQMDSAQRKRFVRRIILEQDLFRARAGENAVALAGEMCAFLAQCRCEGVSPEQYAAWVRRRRRALESGDHALDPEALEAERARLPEDEDRARLFEAYERRILREGALTFDEDIWLPLRLLRERRDVAAFMRDECRHIVVDEFQDWNPSQIDLLAALAPPPRGAGRPPDICVVGDDDQSIYAFRGADDQAFRRFADLYPARQTVELRTNYRSAPAIIAVSNGIIRRAAVRFAPGKVSEAVPGWKPEREGAEASVAAVAITKDEEKTGGRLVAAMIDAQRRAEPWLALSQIAVLCRTGNDADRCVTALEAAGIAASTRASVEVAADPAVGDALAWLRLLADPSSIPDAKRLLLRPPSSIDLALVQEWEAQFRRAQPRRYGSAAPPAIDKPPPFLAWLASQESAAPARALLEVHAALTRFAAANRIDATIIQIIRLANLAYGDPLDPVSQAQRVRNLARVIGFARDVAPRLERPNDPAAFLGYLDDLDDKERSAFAARLDTAEEPDPASGEGVQVLTAHAAKGLEFDTVYVLRVASPNGYPLKKGDAERKRLPESLTGRPTPERLHEERRVFYVACTRAKRRLIILGRGLATKPKAGEDSADYFAEVALRKGEGVPCETSAEMYARLGVASPDLAAAASALEDAESGAGAAAPGESINLSMLEREITRVRREGARALFDAGRAGNESASVDALASEASDAAVRLAALARLRADAAQRGSAPGPHPHPAVEARRREYAASFAVERRPVRAAAPLELSYSSIATYQKCPACWEAKYQHLLPEPSTGAMQFGGAVHKALEQYEREAAAAESDGREIPGLERLLALGAERAAALPRQGPDDAVESLARTVEAQLRAAWSLREGAAQTLKVEEEFAFSLLHNGHAHRISGKIDRVSLAPGGGYTIVDYKTGGGSNSLRKPKPDDLQMGIYALALGAIFPVVGGDEASEPFPSVGDVSRRIPPGEAQYWLLASGEIGRISLADLDLSKVRAAIAEVIDGILAGRFEKKPECPGICTMLRP